MASKDPTNPSHAVFDLFIRATTCKDVQRHFAELCKQLDVDPKDYRNFYTKLKERLNFWNAKALLDKLDVRASHQDYQQGKACAKNKCLVLGAGPCGLRTAIELSLLGAQVVVLEKRESFSRNNVLHLWPYTIYDLRGLGAKKLYGKFCTGTLDHVSIRQLQLMLLKICLLLGVEVHTGVEFQGLIEPSENKGWTTKLNPPSHPAASFQFDVFISAGGGRFVPDGFKHIEMRGKLAIGITTNFINKNTAAEGRVPEISGVARIYNQKFFQNLLTETGIDLENIVYYKDDTHYFVMTAKKKSLLNKGVIKQDFSDPAELLAAANVDQDALRSYAHDAARFSTALPGLEFVRNYRGQPDVAMFDFTCMYRAKHASLVRERKGKKLLIGLVGDCLVEPFWPLGTGIARGFLAAFDVAWMVRSWGLGVPHLQVMAERESLYQLLSQTTPENISKNYLNYSIDPSTRYQHVNLSSIKTSQVQNQYDANTASKKPDKRLRQDSSGGFDELLRWCQHNTAGYERVKVQDLSQSWTSGLALCALIHRFRPQLIDMSSLDESNAIHNNRLAFSILQRECGISPIMSANDMANSGQIDKLSMFLYLTQVHDAFNVSSSSKEPTDLLAPSRPLTLSRQSAVFFISKLKHNSLQRRKAKLAAEKETKEKETRMGDEDNPVAPVVALPVAPEEPQPHIDADCGMGMPAGSSSECYFCGQRVYVLERISAEGKFFHRSCFACHHCGITLRLGGYTFHQNTGRFYCELHSEDEGTGNGTGTSSTKDSTIIHQTNGENDPTPPPSDDDDFEDEGEDDDDEYYLDCKDTEPHQPEGKQDHNRLDCKDEPLEPPPTKPLADLPPEDWLAAPANEEPEENPPSMTPPVPKPRLSRQSTPTPSPPVPKPRTVHLVNPSPPEKCSSPPVPLQDNGPDSRPKQSLRKLQLSDAEKSQLVNLQSLSLDSDSETPGGSSSCSSSSATAGRLSPPKPTGTDGQEEEGYWSGSTTAHVRDRKNRRCFKRKEEPGGQQTRVRSKFSPWNLSSPRLSREHRLSVLNSHPGRVGKNLSSPRLSREHRLSVLNLSSPRLSREHRLSVLNSHPGSVETTFRHGHSTSEDGVDGDDDDDDEDEMLGRDDTDLFDDKFQTMPSDPVEAEKIALKKMRTLERRAKMSELQRFRKAQSIQRRLEEIEVTFKELEEKGVELERALRQETGNGGSPIMIEQWIELVHQKNGLVSEESDLMVASRQLELEDKQSMLELELRKYMDLSDSEKTAEQRAEEEHFLQQKIEVVDMRDALVAFLDEKRLKESEEEQAVFSIMEAKRHSTSAGAQVHWA